MGPRFLLGIGAEVVMGFSLLPHLPDCSAGPTCHSLANAQTGRIQLLVYPQEQDRATLNKTGQLCVRAFEKSSKP